MQFSLFPDEQEVANSIDRSVTITTHRIKASRKLVGYLHEQSMMLEHITSCENKYRSWPLLLLVSGIFLLFTCLYYNNSNDFAIGTLMTLVFVLAYFFTRRSAIIISSASTRIYIPIKSGNRERAIDFIDKIEQAIHELKVKALSA